MQFRPLTAAPPRKLAYTQSTQYTHPPLFPIFRPASAPRTEVIDVHLPHQTDGNLMCGVEAAPLSYSGGHPPLARRMHFPLHPCPDYPPQQLDRVMDTCLVEDRRSRDGAAVQRTPALFCFASSSKPAKWRSSVIAQSSTFPSFSCDHPATCRSCHVTGDSRYVSKCSGDAFCPALVLKTMQNDLCMH